METNDEQIFNLLGNFSYSRLEKYVNCPYAYKLSYVDGNYVSANSLALSVGSLLHKVNEYICSALINGESIDYDRVLAYIDTAGSEDEIPLELDSSKKDEGIKGTKILQKEFFEDYYTTNIASRQDYYAVQFGDGAVSV